MVPRMKQQPLRPKHRDGRLLRNQRRSRKRRGDDLGAAAGDDAGDEPARERLGGGEGARGERELVHEALVARHFGHTRERADVRCQSDVDFLSTQFVSAECSKA